MKVVSNNKLIQKNRKIGSYTTTAALAALGIGLYFSFTQPEQIMITFGALILGFILTQIGVYYSSRWGRSPRPDEKLTAALKGMDDRTILYNYVEGIPHMLLGPNGAWILESNIAGGEITYDESRGKYKQKGGNWYFKLFGQETVGNPDVDARNAIRDATKSLSNLESGDNLPELRPLVFFTSKNAVVNAQDAPTPVLSVDKVKDYIRRQQKSSPQEFELIKRLQDSLPKEDIN